MAAPGPTRSDTGVLQTWSSNQLVLARARQLGSDLRSAGVRCVAIKGTAVIAHYPTTAGRPIGDIDVVVAPGDLPAAIAVLADNGFTTLHRVTPLALTYRHAVAAVAADGIWADLHWRVSPGLPVGTAATPGGVPWPVVRAGEPPPGHPLAGSGLLVPTAADELAIVAIHGCRRANRDVGHLADDARVLVDANPGLDLADVAGSLAEAGHLRRGLQWLAAVVDGIDPSTVAGPFPGAHSERWAQRCESLASRGARSTSASWPVRTVALVAGEAEVCVRRPWLLPRRVAGRVRWQRSAELAQAMATLGR